MAQTTTYTCDRCDADNTNNAGWVKSGSTYYKRDYCPSCVKQLLELGLEAETHKGKQPTT